MSQLKDRAIKLFGFVRRGIKKPPDVIALWLWRKVTERWASNRLPRLARTINARKVAKSLEIASEDFLFDLARKNSPFPIFNADRVTFLNAIDDPSREAIYERADTAMRREVSFLGSSLVILGQPVDWATDFKTGHSWPMDTSRSLNVLDLERDSDIKIPWELSRLQWLLPVGQAYVLNPDEKYAVFARDIINEWIHANPICMGPNWICAMDVALRGISICWLLQAFKASPAWQDRQFRARLLVQLYLHCEFIVDNLEWSDVAGNHLTSDLAGLVIIGLTLGGRGKSSQWIAKGWRLLEEQLPLQVLDDGVCREASVPYHRFVAELFLLPALARRENRQAVPNAYWRRLAKMTDFIESYSGHDGIIPMWGDADDGRALPLGSQALNDHRYLIETLRGLTNPPAQPVYDETLWWLGIGDGETQDANTSNSKEFADAGVYILRRNNDLVFTDFGPVGMAGRGGHGHNDCLSFEATLCGHRLIVDPGCFVYTSDWRARNQFRGTAAHNTPCIDNTEINRIARYDWLWYLENDAVPEVRHWSSSEDTDLLVGAHTGYQRLKSPVTPVRAIMLEKSTHRLFIADGFEGEGEHAVRIPYTFAPGIKIETVSDGVWRILCQTNSFLAITSAPNSWVGTIGSALYSPSYGVAEDVASLVFERDDILSPIAFSIIPEKDAPPDPAKWLSSIIVGNFPVPGFNP